jgi:hypothetical protein
MRDPEAVIEPLPYNHEQEAIRARERRADDWGGDDVFATHPRRRVGHRTPTGELTMPPRRGHDPAARPADQPVAEDPIVELELDPRSPDEDAPRGPEASVVAEELTDGIKWAPSAGRRTVQITGHPDAAVMARPFTSDRRRRPPRTAGERLVARPDRVAAWAFGLGMLLIAVAVSTAGAAPL